MIPECRHILPTGRKCHAVAMRGKAFCYFHMLDKRAPARKRATAAKKKQPAEASLALPKALDRTTINTAIGRVLHTLAAGRIATRRASALLYGLQLAQQQLGPRSTSDDDGLCDLPTDSTGELDLKRLSPQGFCAIEELIRKITLPPTAPGPQDHPGPGSPSGLSAQP